MALYNSPPATVAMAQALTQTTKTFEREQDIPGGIYSASRAHMLYSAVILEAGSARYLAPMFAMKQLLGGRELPCVVVK